MKRLLLISMPFFLSACQNDTTVTAPKTAQLYEIDLQNSVTLSNPEPLKAIGRYDDGTTLDISKSVTWHVVSGEDVIKMAKSGLVTPIKLGSATIYATKSGISSFASTINIVNSFICGKKIGQQLGKQSGGGIDDKSTDVSKCLKIHEVYGPNNQKYWFSSSPSVEFLKKINYTDYKSHRVVDGQDISLFSVDRELTNSGQAARWCHKLSDMKFAGKNNWRLPTIQEIDMMWSYNNDSYESLYTRFKWLAGNSGSGLYKNYGRSQNFDSNYAGATYWTATVDNQVNLSWTDSPSVLIGKKNEQCNSLVGASYSQCFKKSVTCVAEVKALSL